VRGTQVLKLGHACFTGRGTSRQACTGISWHPAEVGSNALERGGVSSTSLV
jgi:hypothetical protein